MEKVETIPGIEQWIKKNTLFDKSENNWISGKHYRTEQNVGMKYDIISEGRVMSQIVEPWNHISCPGIHLEREIAEAREISLKERPKWMINVGEKLNNNHDNEKDIWRKKIQWSLMCHSLMFWTLLNTISKKKIWICVHLFLHLKVSSNEVSP